MTWKELDNADPQEMLLLAPGLGNRFPPVKLDSTVTIGMAAHGNLDITIFTLRSLLASVSGAYELILVDDASPDQTGKLFELVPYVHSNTKVFRFPLNIEYGGSLNTILSHATGDKIIFISNDIFVSPAYIAELLSILNNHNDSGLVRGCSNFVDNCLMTHNINDCGELTNIEELFYYAQTRSESHNGIWLDDPFLTGDAFLISRRLLDHVGYLDQRFFGYFVDHDLGVRARQAGFRPRLALGAFAWHQHNANFEYLHTDEKQNKLKRRWARVNQNWAVFRQKYNLPVNMPYEGVKRIPWDGLAMLPLSENPPACDNSLFCLPAPKTDEWVQYRVSSLSEEARKTMLAGDLHAAEQLCTDALKLSSSNSAVLTVLGTVRLYQGRNSEAIKTFRRALKSDPTNSKAQSNLLVCLNYDESSSQHAIYRESRRWEKLHCSKKIGTSSGCHARSRIRIAYISPDFRRHSVGYFFLPLLESHDRSRFEIYCLSDVKKTDDTTSRMAALADGWRNISVLSNDEVESVIREVAPDFLVDLAGHTGQTIRLELFARRLAPIQISWLGYPNTTGLASMDFRFTDAIADPLGLSDKLHSEKLVRISDCFICYKPPEEAPEISTLPALKNGYVTFGSFNMLPKIQDLAIKAWSDILHLVPGSKLFLKNHYFRDDATVARMLGRFEKFGIGMERLIIKPSDPDTASHLTQYSNVDIALDTFPYNGTTTTCEALWMGVPVVTLSGDRHSGRVGESLLSAVRLGCNTAYSINEYVAKAVYIADNLDKLSELRAELRTVMKRSSLCSASLFTNNFELALNNLLQGDA